MNVFEQHDVKPGDYVEFTISRVNTFTSRDVVATTNSLTTYKGEVYFVDDAHVHFRGGTSVPLSDNISLDVVERAERRREIGWYEVNVKTWRREARYWTGFGWALSPQGMCIPIEFDNVRFIGK